MSERRSPLAERGALADSLEQRVRSELRLTRAWTCEVRAGQRFGTSLFDLGLEVDLLDPNIYYKNPNRPRHLGRHRPRALRGAPAPALPAIRDVDYLSFAWTDNRLASSR